jgi:putative ABC transport system permease protein
MKGWLEGFAYRINIWSAWWIFVGWRVWGLWRSRLFTISFQAVKAALANPVNSLRSE